VQPPEPLDLWHSPAFEPTVRKDEDGFDAVYARGAVDDKGQVWCHAEAITAWQQAGGVPVNLTMLIEGEEEIGSENLTAFVKQQKDLLKADLCLISDTDQFRRGLSALSGEGGFSTLERTWVRPTCDINGLSGGYQGPGAKTVIGSWASAKVSMRLVPKQDPAKIQAAFRKAIRDRAPKNVKVEFTLEGHNALPVVVPIDNNNTRLASEAVKIGFGKDPVL